MSSIGSPQSALAVGLSFPIIDGIFVILRFCTRRKLKAGFGTDDWLCIPAWVCLTGCCVSMVIGISKNAFSDAPPSDPAHVTNQEHIMAQVTAAIVILWMCANVFIKLVMLFFYRRIFALTSRTFNICSRILIWLSIIWFVYAVASWLLYCGTNFKANFEGGWKGCTPWGFQIQMGVFAMDSFIDFCLLVMPIRFVWRLELDWKRKIGLSVVFCLGGFAFFAGVINTVIQLEELTNPALVRSGGEANFFQGSSILFSNWPAIEIGVGLLASNLPLLQCRIKEAYPHVLGFSISSFRHVMAAFSVFAGKATRKQSSSQWHSGRFQQGTPETDDPPRLKSLEISSEEREDFFELQGIITGMTEEDIV